MTNRQIKTLRLHGVVTLLCYLLGAMIGWSLWPGDWPSIGRFFWVLITAFVNFLVAGIFDLGVEDYLGEREE